MAHHIRTGPVGPPAVPDLKVPTADMAVDDICANPNFSQRRDSIAEVARPELPNVPKGSPLYQPPNGWSQILDDLGEFLMRLLFDDHTCYQYRIRPEPIAPPPALPDAAKPTEDFCPEESDFYLPQNPWPELLRILWPTLLITSYFISLIWAR
jgi:hypothetical protein